MSRIDLFTDLQNVILSKKEFQRTKAFYFILGGVVFFLIKSLLAG